jgi:hypothetical protein
LYFRLVWVSSKIAHPPWIIRALNRTDNKEGNTKDFNFFALALLGKSVHPHELKDAQVEAKDVPVFLFWVSSPRVKSEDSPPIRNKYPIVGRLLQRISTS